MRDTEGNDPMNNVLDGYQSAKDEGERRLYLRAAVRGCVAAADGLAKALRALLAAVSR